MKVKEVIISALNILGRAELASALADEKTLDAEQAETVNTLLYCFNSVEDELARRYIPLTASERLVSLTCEYSYSKFSHVPLKIKKVYDNGKEIEFKLYPQYMRVESTYITVEYEYAPEKKKLDGTVSFGEEVSEYLLALGTASEYCFINGEIEAGELWEKKYRREIDGAQRTLPSCGCLPPRRWV